MSVTIRQKYDGLKAYLDAGVFNLTDDEVLIARKACADLLVAIPKVVLDFSLEDDRRTTMNQLKIILRQLDEISTPTFTTRITVGADRNLFDIALEYLGDALRWNEIAKLNGIEDPILTDITTLQLPVR